METRRTTCKSVKTPRNQDEGLSRNTQGRPQRNTETAAPRALLVPSVCLSVTRGCDLCACHHSCERWSRSYVAVPDSNPHLGFATAASIMTSTHTPTSCSSQGQNDGLLKFKAAGLCPPWGMASEVVSAPELTRPLRAGALRGLPSPHPRRKPHGRDAAWHRWAPGEGEMVEYRDERRELSRRSRTSPGPLALWDLGKPSQASHGFKDE